MIKKIYVTTKYIVFHCFVKNMFAFNRYFNPTAVAIDR